jgi:formyl-CoA transferase
VGRPDLATDPRFAVLVDRRANAKDLFAILDPIFLSQDWSYWLERLTACDITFGPIRELSEIPGDRQMEAAGAVVASADPALGRTIASPIWVEGIEKRVPGMAPTLGQHTDAVLAEAGYDEAAIRQMRAAGIVG